MAENCGTGQKIYFYGNEKVIQDEKMVKEDKKEGKRRT